MDPGVFPVDIGGGRKEVIDQGGTTTATNAARVYRGGGGGIGRGGFSGWLFSWGGGESKEIGYIRVISLKVKAQGKDYL